METKTAIAERLPRKRGPVPGPERIRTTVYLDPELVDWGKVQPGGLSELMRRLLQDAKQKSEAGQVSV